MGGRAGQGLSKRKRAREGHSQQAPLYLILGRVIPRTHATQSTIPAGPTLPPRLDKAGARRGNAVGPRTRREGRMSNEVPPSQTAR